MNSQINEWKQYCPTCDKESLHGTDFNDIEICLECGEPIKEEQ